MMITIAVAGGSSPGLGRAVVTALQHYEGLRPIVLTRKTSTVPDWLQQAGVEVRRVDYGSEEDLLGALADIHTLICTLLALDGTWASTQKRLLRVGLRAGISRFAPAEFGIGPLVVQDISMLTPTIEVRDACREAKKTNPAFEYALFHTGLFMNYLGYGAPDEDAAMHGMNDSWVWVWDVKNMKAVIPLTREGKVPRQTLTEIGDIGRFVAAACLLRAGSWEEDFSMVGETRDMSDVVEIIEKVRGRKMDVTFRSYEQIEAEENKEMIEYPNKFWLQLELAAAKNLEKAVIVPPILNKLCPEVKPLSVEQYMTKFWPR